MPGPAMTEVEAWQLLHALGAALHARDPVICAAHAVGIRKSDIHRVTGLNRNTIDDILRRASRAQTTPPIP